MKKLILGIIIAIIILGIGSYIFISHRTNPSSPKSSTTSLQSSSSDSTTTKTSISTNTPKTTNSSTNSQSATSATSSVIANKSATTINTSAVTNQINTASNNNLKANSKTPDTIKVEPFTSSTSYSGSSPVITNTTGKPIPTNILVTVMKNWISTWQFSYSNFADCNSTVWGKPWLDTVTNTQFLNAFIQANGSTALNKTITAAELNSATEKLSENAIKNNPTPLTLTQVKNYVVSSLKNSGQTLLKITPEAGGGYYVYTSPYNSNTTNTYPYWVIRPGTGYMSS